MRLLRWSGMVAAVAMLAACSDSDAIVGTQMDLRRAERTWQRSGVDDYDMTVQVTGAWFGGTAVVQVRDGVPISVQSVGEGPELPANVFSQYDTVEELFGILDRAVADGADHVDARFHIRLGVPVEAFIDHYENGADDEHGFIVQSFQTR